MTRRIHIGITGRQHGSAGVLLVIQANPDFDMSDPTRAPNRPLLASQEQIVPGNRKAVPAP